jgi:hypothetical protein
VLFESTSVQSLFWLPPLLIGLMLLLLRILQQLHVRDKIGVAFADDRHLVDLPEACTEFVRRVVVDVDRPSHGTHQRKRDRRRPAVLLAAVTVSI